jgi:hypothetical protein
MHQYDFINKIKQLGFVRIYDEPLLEILAETINSDLLIEDFQKDFLIDAISNSDEFYIYVYEDDDCYKIIFIPINSDTYIYIRLDYNDEIYKIGELNWSFAWKYGNLSWRTHFLHMINHDSRLDSFTI